MKGYARKKYVINKDLQLRLLFKFLFSLLIISFVIVWNFYYATWTMLANDLRGLGISVLKGSISIRMIILSCSLILVFTTFSIFISHRIAGPIYKIKSVIDKMASGDLPPQIYLRKNDEFKELAESVNKLIEYLNQNQKK
jgi:methyl-accepting chemotaxis protein